MFGFKKKHTHRVLLTIEEGIATVTLNRGEKYNGLDMPMFDALIKTIETLRHNRSIRVVILNANGKVFCTGLDIKSIKNNPFKIKKLLQKPEGVPSNLVQDVAYQWRRLNVPVIAVTHGKCLGGGLQIAMGADFRFSTPDCEFSILEAKWGLIPDMGGMVAWREVLRGDVLRDLVYTGRIVEAKEALAIGLITRIEDDPMQAAKDYAQVLISQSPDALAAGKKLISDIWTADDDTVLDLETTYQKRIANKWNQLAAASRNLRKKPLKYHRRKFDE